jgi:TRAP-type mannitol/chloroaromatic compound transport system substrate-binding protein
MANAWMQAKYDVANPAALRKLLIAGTRLMPFSTPIMEACLNGALDLYHEVSSANPEFKKVYDSMIAFRGDEYLWWQVAEYSNDTFLIRNRMKT